MKTLIVDTGLDILIDQYCALPIHCDGSTRPRNMKDRPVVDLYSSLIPGNSPAKCLWRRVSFSVAIQKKRPFSQMSDWHSHTKGVLIFGRTKREEARRGVSRKAKMI